MNTRILLAVGSSLVLSTAPLSQHDEPPQLESVFQRSFGIVEHGERVRGGGADYKVEIDGGALTFTPALGAAAPRNLPLSFRLESIRRGDTILYSTAGDAARPPQWTSGDAVRTRRGAEIVESFELRPDGVEQTYTFPRPLAGTGDLVVRGVLETELATEVRGEAPDGVLFEAPGLGGVLYGGVTGVDAEGRTAPGSLRYDGEAMELVLPSAFLDSASYPMVLDPLIGAVLPVAGGFDDLRADVAYEPNSDQYLVVWQRAFSNTDVDVRGQRLAADGSFVLGLIGVQGTSAAAMHPTVASVRATERFVVAWQEGPSVFGPFDIRGRAVDPGGTVSSVFDVATSAASEIDPDLGGSSSATGSSAFVVYDEELGGIRSMLVTVPGSGTPSASGQLTYFVDSPGIAETGKPAISKSGGADGRFCVVFEVDFPGNPGDTRIHAAAIDSTGSFVDGFLQVTPAGLESRAPDVDGDGSRWTVAYQRTAAPGDRDVLCTPVRLAGSSLTASPEVAVAADPGDDEFDPAVSFLGPKVAVAWSDALPSGGYQVRVRGLDPETCEACGSEEAVPVQVGALEAGARLASKRSGHAQLDSDEAMLVFHSFDLAPPFASEIRAQRIEAIGIGGDVQDLGGGCAGGGVASPFGPAAIGNGQFGFQLSGADPLSFGAVLNVAQAGLPTSVCGGCVSLPLQFVVGQVFASAGSALAITPLPCDTALVGASFDAQWLVFPTSLSPCKLFPALAVSNILRVTIGE